MYWYVHNLQGDIVAIADTTGQKVVEYKYDAWGKPLTQSTLTTAYDELADLNPFRYRGYVWDQETELYYLRSRYYNPVWGRFISADTLLIDKSTFAYTKDAPIMYEDNDGKAPTIVEAALMADHVYQGDTVILRGGWTKERTIESGDSMTMGVYSREIDGKKEYALVNQGTTWYDPRDWHNNFWQLCGWSHDVSASVDEASDFVEKHKDSEITFIGHSKGGAEAAVNALYTNKNAILFNPMSVSFETKGFKELKMNYSAQMTSFVVKGEVLNKVFGGHSRPIGSVIYLPNQKGGAITNHLMPAVFKGLWKAGFR